VQIAAEFITSATSAKDFPRERLPEIAFVGRSNVGKSSLINALARRTIARTSASPGKTRLVNVYRVQRGSTGPRYLVDLPGYGYAGGGDAAAAEFQALTEAYFGRPGDRAVLLLVDSRHPGLASDMETWEWIRSQPCARGVVATKVDKLTRAERARHVREFETLFDLPVALVSASTGEGLDELWKMIASLPNRTAA
jgi:GTP-binding protein